MFTVIFSIEYTLSIMSTSTAQHAHTNGPSAMKSDSIFDEHLQKGFMLMEVHC